MRTRIYAIVVNKHPGIKYRYHKFHDGSVGAKKLLSWLYLIWLNFAYYVLCIHSLGKMPEMENYETKGLQTRMSESEEYLAKNPKLTLTDYLDTLMSYDVVSFDIFDTLILRPMSQPTDVFYLVGEKMGISDFTRIRAWAEWDARMKCNARNGHMEITLSDIWKNLAEDVGCNAKLGEQIETDTELSLCYANPFMLDVWKELIKREKEVIVVSDMYLPKETLKLMLENAGYTGYKKLYVSCEYGKNKASGSLFKLVKEEHEGKRIIHVGDNPHSDDEMARKNGFSTCPYPNVNHNVQLYRPFDMSYLVGSAYRGIVSNHLYNGTRTYSMEYEYGFIYGGLFVLGYCEFIHRYAKHHGIHKLLFLSRDGDILKQVYDRRYPNDNTEYVYWSRKAATKLMADEDKHDFFRRFIYHKVNQEYTIKEILHAMELDFLCEELSDWKDIWLTYAKKDEADSKHLAYLQLEQCNYTKEKYEKELRRLEEDFAETTLEKKREKYFVDLKASDELTDKNGYLLRRFIEAKWDEVVACYEEQQIAAKEYYLNILKDTRNVVAIDIGWAGSGALALSHLVEEVWGIPCKIVGIIAGTNTVHNAEPDATEPFLQSGKLVSYLYSQSQNRDLLKIHDPNKNFNVYWELLLSSPTPQFTGFALDDEGQVKLCFGKYDANQEGIKDVQSGILDFVCQYQSHFKAFPYMFNISGRDAYAPMIVAASNKEKYLKAIDKKFALEINVN